MNRADRRRMHKALGFKWSGNATPTHRCDMDSLTRVKGLDGAVPGDTCRSCGGEGIIFPRVPITDDVSIEEKPCPLCVDGQTPITDFNGYACPKCLTKWIRMSYTIRDVTHVDWKTAAELIKGE